MYYSKCHASFKASRELKAPLSPRNHSASLPKNPNIFDFERFEIVEEEGDNDSSSPSQNFDEDSADRSYRNLYFPEVPQFNEAEAGTALSPFIELFASDCVPFRLLSQLEVSFSLCCVNGPG